VNQPPSRLQLRDLVSPSVAAVISVIVNYGGTFVLRRFTSRFAVVGCWPACWCMH